MLATNPTRDSALINFEPFGSRFLGSKEGHKVAKYTVHITPPYGIAHILNYRNAGLQGYGSTRNTLQMEFKDRLKAARRHAQLNQAELAERAGITQTSISDLERGKSKATAYVAKIASICGVDALWLSEGKGEMVRPASTESRHSSNVSISPQPNTMFQYPVISWATAGSWEEASEPYPPGISHRYEMSEYDAKGPAFWLEVKGDSMTAPSGVSIPEGMMILVDTEADVRPGKLVVAKLPASNEATFKKLVEDGGVRYLRPLNPEYKMIECGKDCRIIGVAVRVMGKL